MAAKREKVQPSAIAAKQRAKMGRPTNIDSVIGQRDDGTDITVAQAIVMALEAGNYFEHACAAGGVDKNTGNDWMRIAGKALIRSRGRTLDDVELTDFERACCDFSVAVTRAESQWVVGALGTLERLGRGGIPQTTTTVKTERREDADGKVEFVETERVTVTKHTLPNAQVLEWRLSRRFPDLFSEHVEVTTRQAQLTVEERAEALNDALKMIDDLADVEEPSQ